MPRSGSSTLLAILTGVGLAGCSNSPDPATATGRAQINATIARTCHGVVRDGADILAYPPDAATGTCQYLRGPLLVSDWLTGSTALADANQVRIDNEARYAGDMVPGGVFLGMPPFVYQDTGGHWRRIVHLYYLAPAPAGLRLQGGPPGRG